MKRTYSLSEKAVMYLDRIPDKSTVINQLVLMHSDLERYYQSHKTKLPIELGWMFRGRH